jgi:hypothetical protein
MPFDPTLADAISRVRFAVGDTAATSLLPDATYTALLALKADDEVLAARAVAGNLASIYAQQPDSVSSAGESAAWRSRVSHWAAIASGAQPTGLEPVAEDAEDFDWVETPLGPFGAREYLRNRRLRGE